MSGIRVALRIARRDALRAKGRSALVVAMVGLPMLALAFADVTLRTAELPPEERARRDIGAADLVAELVSGGPIEQLGLHGVSAEAQPLVPGDGGLHAPESEPDVLSLLPPGSRVLPWRTHFVTGVRAGERVVSTQLTQTDLADPLAAGITRLLDGTLPRAAGEAALTRDLARVLGARPGDTVTVQDGATFRVTAVVVEPGSLGEREVYVSPATTLPASFGPAEMVQRRWAVDLPPGQDAVALVPALNEHGLRVSPRAWVIDPPDVYDDMSVAAEEVGVAVVVVGLAALEIVLLAGAAFAVGARRRRRELALVAATGGDRGDVRRVVLAGGVVLGAVAGLLAVAGGIVGVVLLRPWLGQVNGAELGPLDVRPLELAVVVLLGAGTALLAAALPARAAARQPVVGALTGRRGDVRLRKRVPVLALAAIACGAALAFWGAGTGTGADGSRPANFNLVLAGAVLAELGFVASAPGLVALVGAAASRLPLSLRLAARDAARHRTRSGPAVAAVVAAVAGSVAISVYAASDAERQRRDYTPFLTQGAVRIGTATATGEPVAKADIDAAVGKLPVRTRVDTSAVAEDCTTPRVPCGAWLLELPKQHECAGGDIACMRAMPPYGGLSAGPPELLEVAIGRPDARAEAALRDGRAVVLDERWIVDGHVTFVRERYAGNRQVDVKRVRVPAVAVRGARFSEAPAALVTPETARRHGLPLVPGSTFVLTSRVPTAAEEAAARGVLTRSGVYYDLYIERGFRAGTGLMLLVLALASGAVTLAATAIATGLAAADSRPDLATLAAVGAAPRIRRRLVVAQAATVAALGSGLGLLAGLVPAIAVVSARAELPLVLPWRSFATSALLVPLVAALAVGAFTRAKLPLERRLA